MAAQLLLVTLPLYGSMPELSALAPTSTRELVSESELDIDLDNRPLVGDLRSRFDRADRYSARDQLAWQQLVATKLSLAMGSPPSIVPTVEAADAYLVTYPPGTSVAGAVRAQADQLKSALDVYNNGCTLNE